MSAITIDCPDELLVALASTREQFEQEARFLLAAKLYELGRLSSGKAAQLCDLDRVTFLLTLHRAGVAAVDLDERELAEELRYVRGA